MGSKTIGDTEDVLFRFVKNGKSSAKSTRRRDHEYVEGSGGIRDYPER